MNHKIKIQKELTIIQERNRLLRIETFYALLTANELDQAIRKSHLAKTTTLKEARAMSAYINSISKIADTKPHEFIRNIEETSNSAIDHFDEYKLCLERCPYEKRVLKSFAHWFANSRLWNTLFIKANLNYILNGGAAIQDYSEGNISKQELDEYLKILAEGGKRYFTFNPQGIFRAFILASEKWVEIENKISNRTLSKLT